MSGESEATIRELFASAKAAAPSLVFIDEIDAITPKRENAQWAPRPAPDVGSRQHGESRLLRSQR